MHVKTGDTHYMEFIVFDSDGKTTLTGQAASCTSSLRKNGAAASETVTIAEIGSTGRYTASFASLTAGFFHLSVTCPDDRVVGEHFEVEDADLDSLDTKVTFIFDIEGGRWKIDTSTNKMYFYKADGTSEVAVFTLKDAAGVAGYDDPYERTRD
jgi:hypothetical protein